MTYQDALSHAMHPPDASGLENAADLEQLSTNIFLVLMALSRGVRLGVRVSTFGFSNPDDLHDLVM
jgi:hypothetical protein